MTLNSCSMVPNCSKELLQHTQKNIALSMILLTFKFQSVSAEVEASKHVILSLIFKRFVLSLIFYILYLGLRLEAFLLKLKFRRVSS
jgi:hypothetical protein